MTLIKSTDYIEIWHLRISWDGIGRGRELTGTPVTLPIQGGSISDSIDWVTGDFASDFTIAKTIEY